LILGQRLEVEQLQFDDVAFFGLNLNDSDTPVLDVEVSGAGKGQVKKEAEDDPNDATMAINH
jgi:hypothetical protein